MGKDLLVSYFPNSIIGNHSKLNYIDYCSQR